MIYQIGHSSSFCSIVIDSFALFVFLCMFFVLLLCCFFSRSYLLISTHMTHDTCMTNKHHTEMCTHPLWFQCNFNCIFRWPILNCVIAYTTNILRFIPFSVYHLKKKKTATRISPFQIELIVFT